VLDDRRSMTRLSAAETLTIVVYEDVEALYNVDDVLAGLITSQRFLRTQFARAV
jgi:hypothetical protein